MQLLFRLEHFSDKYVSIKNEPNTEKNVKSIFVIWQFKNSLLVFQEWNSKGMMMAGVAI